MGAPSAWGSWGPPSLMGRGGAFSPDGGPAGTCVVGSACAAARGLQGRGGGLRWGWPLVLEGLGVLCPRFPGGLRRSLSLLITAPSSVK